MDLGLQGKVALALGAAGGLGGAIAASLAAEGAHIALADIDATALRGVEAGIKQSGSRALAVPFDLADHAAMNASVAAVEGAFGEIDVLVNITGGPPATPAAGQDRAKWAENFETMVLSVITLTDRVLPGMRRRKWGRIITSTSSGVVSPIPNLAISIALRLSLVGWSMTLAREVSRDGVTANIVVPGRIATKRVNYLDGQKAKRENRSVQEVAAESRFEHSGRPLWRTCRIRRCDNLPRQRQGVIHKWVDDPCGWRLDCKHLTNVRPESMR